MRTKETSSNDETLLLTESEIESTKQEVEIHKKTISDLNNLIDQLKEDTRDNVAQLTHNYKLLSAEHESLKNACTTTDSEVTSLTDKNSQLTAQLNKIINEDLAKLTDLNNQNEQLNSQLMKLQQDVATKQLSVDSLRQTNQGLNIGIATLQQQLAQQTAQITQPPNMTPTPPAPPTPPPLPQNPLFQQQQQRAPTPDPDNVPVTKSHLRELYSQDERKYIPVYKGK